MIDLRDASAPAEAVIEALALQPHPEGGHYRETWRDAPLEGVRGVGTAIVFLLREGERSHWHRVDAAELWIWQAGAPLLLSVGANGQYRLGPTMNADEDLQRLVPRNAGSRRTVLAAGHCAVASSRRHFRSKGSNWRRRAGSLATDRRLTLLTRWSLTAPAASRANQLLLYQRPCWMTALLWPCWRDPGHRCL